MATNPIKVTIAQHGMFSTIKLGDRDVSRYVEYLEFRHAAGHRPEIRMGLIVTEVEISTLGDADHVMMVNLSDEVSTILCSLGWTPPEGHQNVYRIARRYLPECTCCAVPHTRDCPRFELDNASPDAND